MRRRDKFGKNQSVGPPKAPTLELRVPEKGCCRPSHTSLVTLWSTAR